MKSWVAAAITVSLASPAAAGSYRVVLDTPVPGRLIKGHAGVQAADERTQDALVRVIAPGNEVDQRGTVRVLIMNFGKTPYTFGPDQVTIRLGDGTVLKPTPVDDFEKGRVLVERESRHAAAIDIINRNSLSSPATEAGSSQPGAAPSMPTGTSTDASSQDYRSDADLLPGASALNAIYQLLIPLQVGPQQAWGGYYVFDVPKAVQRARTDQPLTILVRTGAEEHRFTGTLHWK